MEVAFGIVLILGGALFVLRGACLLRSRLQPGIPWGKSPKGNILRGLGFTLLGLGFVLGRDVGNYIEVAGWVLCLIGTVVAQTDRLTSEPDSFTKLGL